MKNNLIKTVLLFAIGSLSLLFACNSNKPDQAEKHDHPEGMQHDHEHGFACPMHPEIVGQEGDKCSKCGMNLEPIAEEAHAGNFEMQLKTNPEKIEAKKIVALSFLPKNKNNLTAAVPLDVEHEKKIHLIIVDEDLTWFNHIHPEYQSNGSYTVNETFPHGGNFIAYADYKPSGSHHQLNKINISVEGVKSKTIASTKIRNETSSDKFQVTLKADNGKFVANNAIHFDGVFMLDGKRFDVNNLQNYLGAKGHMVAINTSTKEYIHLHPEVEKDILHFHTTFEKAGIYRVWLQFMYEGKLHTTDFNIQVEEGVAQAQDHDHDDHEDHQH